ncbi:MAG: cytochrome c [Alphaproteobacteria bacterium]|nr:cytochrome c [Alphaproteobacteria bacterium]
MKTVVLTTLSLIVLALIGAAAFVYSGVFNVAAAEPHSAFVYSVLQTARIRSIKARAAGIVVPDGYDTEPKIVGAVGHFVEHCATCHGAPGTKPAEFAKGMNPRPPDLKRVKDRYTPAELFWIVKNGIKMTGMPSMADDGDPMLWATVGLLERLPSMTDKDFNDLWMQAQAQAKGGRGMQMDRMDMHGAGGSDSEKQHKP